ncbi:MAG: right-handed parallel beta-helix repeat-containing protein [Promethearchaeota archaeon]|jgi:parallel beta-helix repeat protein
MIKNPFDKGYKLNFNYSVLLALILAVFLAQCLKYNSNFTEISKLHNSKAEYWQLDYINIDDNWSFINETYEWCSYKNGAYIIENVTIDASDPFTGGIIISDTDDAFIIKNCTIYNSYESEDSAAIKLIRVKNGILVKNNLSNNNGNGIMTLLSDNITINQNLVNNNKENGILIGRSKNTTISSNIINNNEKSGVYIDSLYNFGLGTFRASVNNKIVDNEINSNQLSGVKLVWCDNNNVSKNEIFNNALYGIFLDDYCSGNTVTYNHIKYVAGCILDKNGNNNISDNKCEGDISIPGSSLWVLIICISVMIILNYIRIRNKNSRISIIH